jgi:D-inositol-3-phosphate glycosyltransferase
MRNSRFKMAMAGKEPKLSVALLTAGRDRPYAFGLVTALMAKGITLDVIGGDDLDCPTWDRIPHVRFLNLRGDMSEGASLLRKIIRVLVYYLRLILYSATAKPKIFHILWNNKFETFDRVPLMLYYKFLGKKTVLTVHNVNARARDANDTWFNRLTLKLQYQLVDHLFVHTERMKMDLINQFGVCKSAISVIPFGINNAVPDTNLPSDEARRRLGIAENDRTILFFGNIAPYKGLEYLIDAFRQIASRCREYRLIIAGKPKNCESYWTSLQNILSCHPNLDRILQKIEYIPDDQTELYFRAADVLVLPYRYIYQSGVLFLAYSFGLPVIATDVGPMREEITEGKTGFVCGPEDSVDLARSIETYFSSDLFNNLKTRRQEIRKYAIERHSWGVISESTQKIYRELLGNQFPIKAYTVSSIRS